MRERKKAKGEKRKAENYADAFFFVFRPIDVRMARSSRLSAKNIRAAYRFEVFRLCDKLEPKFRFGGFLCRDADLVNEIVFGFSSICLTIVRPYRSS